MDEKTKPAKKQDRITFQPDPGFRELIEKVAKDGRYGPRRSISFVINRYLEEGLKRDGAL